jgi:hypothetical protein
MNENELLMRACLSIKSLKYVGAEATELNALKIVEEGSSRRIKVSLRDLRILFYDDGIRKYNLEQKILLQ